MDTIVFIGTYKAGPSREAIKAAKRLGYQTVLFTNRSKYFNHKNEFPDVDQMFSTNFTNIENLRQQILKIVLEGQVIKAIISLIDPYVSIAAQLSRDFCGTNVSVSAFLKMENKIKIREALKGTSFNINYLTYSTSESHHNYLQQNILNFPLVIKLPNSTGSRDVYLVETPELFIDFMNKTKQVYPNETLLIEEYVEGDQYLVEAVAKEGKIIPVAIIKQDITFNQRFIVTGYSINTKLSNTFYHELKNSVEKILKTIGFENGTCHLELRLKDDQWKLIEINPRISGGAMNQIIKAAFGIDLVEETIKLYLGHSLSLDRKQEENVYTYYITSKSKGIIKNITGKDKALQSPGVKEVKLNVRKGNKVFPPLSMGHRIGYIISTGDIIDKAEKSAKEAAKSIKIHLRSSKDITEDINLNKESLKNSKGIFLSKE